MRSAAAAFSNPDDPQPEEWRILEQQLQPQLTLPGVQGIAFSQIVRPDQLDSHISKVRSWGFPDYTITPAGQRELYTSVIFLAPFEGRNSRALGYDMYSEPVRRAAMDQARDSGVPTLSGKVDLVTEDENDRQPGVLLYFPLYRLGPGQQDDQNGRGNLIGWTYAPLRLTDFINGTLGGSQQQWNSRIGLSIFDSEDMDPSTLLFNSMPGSDPLATHGQSGHSHKTIDFNGHRWTLAFDYSQSLANVSHMPAWLSLGGGLVISGLLYSLLLSLLTLQKRSQKLADKQTAELRQKQNELIESEFRWKFALEGAGDGVWDWDVANSRVYFSHTWKTMLGYADHDIGDSLDEWSKRIHPDDMDITLRAVQDCLEERTAQYSSEHRVLCKDGHYKWILDRGMVVARDDNNKPLRMLGTHKDISDRKQDEEILKQKQRELLEAQRIAKVGNWVVDIATNNVTWSDEMFYMMGMDPAHGAPNFSIQQSLFTASSWQTLQEAVSDTINHGKPYELELEIIRPDNTRAFMLTHGEAERGSDGSIVRVRGTAADITSRVLARRRIELLGRLYATLSECNEAIVHCPTQDALLARVCEIVVEEGRMAMAWVGLVDPVTSRIVPMHWAGTGTEYLNGIEISIDKNDPHGMGPTGISTRENRPVWISDFRTNPSTQSWQKRGMDYGWASSAALPLCREGKPVGTLTFYSVEPGWFTPEVRSLLEEMARNISFALDKFATEAESKRYHDTLVEAEQRFNSLVEQSLVGAFIMQNKRFVYVNSQLETLLDYPHDGSLLQVDPETRISKQDRAVLLTKIEKLHADNSGNFEHMFTALRRDGTSIEVGVTIAVATYQQKPAIIGMLQDISNRKVAEAQIKRYANNLQQVFMQTVGMITNLVEMRDPYTVGHEKRVAELAVAIGRELNLGDHALEGLQIGGYLHDIGKVSVPGEILAKPGRITAIEYELIKVHPTAGYQILKDVEFPWPVAEIAYQHHERIDGSGYPRGLKGTEILFEARIVAVADVVESMFSHRPYRAGLGLDKALAEIERGCGTAYDADVAAACLRLFRERGFTMPQ